MRFPWLQVDADFIGAHAGDLAAHLEISRREAMGLALDLWTWALARARDDAPPDGIVTGTGAVPDRLLSGSVGWTGPVEQFTGALVAVGLAVRIDGGYRLTGFGRYKATWDKNRRRSGEKPERNRTGSGGEPEPKTYTQRQKEDPAPQAAPAVAVTPAVEGQAALLVVPIAEKPKRPPTAVAQWAEEAEAKRKAKAPSDAPPDELKKHQWPKLGAALKAHGALTLTAAYDLYLAAAGYPQEHAYPLGLFISQVNEWVSRAQAAAAKARLQSSSGGDRPRLPPRESPPESTQPAAPARRVIL